MVRDQFAFTCMLRYNGKHRCNHEKSAHGLIIEGMTNANETWTCTSVDSDNMFNYQCSLMDHGLLYMNFTDAITGDGDRIMRCWKYLLLHFYSDKGSTKYAVEALYLQLQQQAFLSPRQAYRQRWNRGVNNRGVRGKNVSLDLDVQYCAKVLGTLFFSFYIKSHIQSKMEPITMNFFG